MDPLEEVQFRAVQAGDREAIREIASRTWDGHDFLGRVFDRWVSDPRGYFAGMILDGRLIGCARLMRIDARRGWLEGLRVHPEFQGSGLGRSMSIHLFREAIRRGYETLHFSTYFGNRGSITISEQVGFRIAARYTNLELSLEQDPAAPSGIAPAAAEPGEAHPHRIRRDTLASTSIAFEEGLPPVTDWIWNDWLSLPPDLPDLAGYFPDAVTLRDRDGAMVLAPNTKSPECLEICWMDFPEDQPPERLLAAIPRLAREAGFESVHLMLPERLPLPPLLRAAFAFEERALDTFRYEARCEELKINKRG